MRHTNKAIMVILESISWVTIVSTIAAVVGVVFGVLSYLNTRQQKKKKKLEALKNLEQARNELCVAMNIGEINTMLNNAIALCDERNSDSKSLNGIWNQLQSVLTEVESKWSSLKLQLTSSGNNNLSEQLDAVIQEYLFCFRDVETVFAKLRCDKVDVVEDMVTSENSVEMKNIIEAAKPLYTDVYEFVKQVISLRFKDLEIPDFAAKIRQLWDDESKLPFNTNTRLYAAMGDPIAQNALGVYYIEQKKFRKAFEWFKKAAEQGEAVAQFNVGVLYLNGEGVEKDAKVAFEWFKKAAEHGYAVAQSNVGVFYLNGEVVEKDAKEAFEWFKKAAEQGDAGGQNNLGTCYYFGVGVEKDVKEAFEWLKRAAEQGEAGAQFNVGVFYLNGEVVEKDAKVAFEWFKKAAEQGDSKAQSQLGKCYGCGLCVEKDAKKAFEWYKKAAEQGNSDAQYRIGYCYDNEDGVEKDAKTAFEWYKKAAEQGNHKAQLGLGYRYDTGKGCDQDYEKAFYWYNKASESKEDIDTYRRTMYNIGVMYEFGTIGMGSTGAAIGFYEIAAQYGDNDAQCRLGYCYENGIGVKEVDLEKAKYWYGEAAKHGHADAIENLKRLEKSE